MKLHFVRHGKAEKFSSSGKDFDRNLSEKGIRQSQELGDYLAANKINKDIYVWCSSAERTTQTLDHLQHNMVFTNVRFERELYLCSKDQFLSKVWGIEHGEDLLIVGHNFGISDLAQYFIDEYVELKTGEYICIEFAATSWKETSFGNGITVDRYRASVDL